MMVPDWLSYVGAVTGIVGTITGGISYHRTSKMKALDLRLDLRKRASDIGEQLEDLPRLIEKANTSRFEVLAASGLLNSGATEVWKKQVADDGVAAARLRANFRIPDNQYKDLSSEALETTLVEIHQLQRAVEAIAQRYRDALAADVVEVGRIREDHRARFGRG